MCVQSREGVDSRWGVETQTRGAVWAQDPPHLPARATSCPAVHGPGVRTCPSCVGWGRGSRTSSPTFYSYKDSRALGHQLTPPGRGCPLQRPTVRAPVGTATCGQMLPSGHAGNHCPRAPESPAGPHLQGRRPWAQLPSLAQAGLLQGGGARGTALPGGTQAGGPDQRDR